MREFSRWGLGFLVSLLVHGATILLLVPAYAPQKPVSQPMPQSKLQLDTVEAPRHTATPKAAEGTDAAETAASSTSIGAGAIPQFKARPVAAPSERQSELDYARDDIQSSAPDAVALAPSLPNDGDTLKAKSPETEIIALAEASGIATASLEEPAETVPPTFPDIETSVPSHIPATSAKATLAWKFGDRLVTDPQALSTIQAFMTPGALEKAVANAGDIRDDLSSLLTSVDCARLSATFLPESGTLELHGHIPDPVLSGPIIKALRQQVGEGIPVTGNLLHLPKPQCGALGGIASVGLPQSTDQFTNSLLVGETSHARAYSYSEGQRLQFDLTAPDYGAFVYVDYFSADGNVIHLVPNQTIALQKHDAKSVVGVGKDTPGKAGLHITIGPPYGQEIATAFATSRQLYDGVRPVVEPAGPYLEYVKERVASARAADPEFKGEWVYFFITTSPATQ